MERYTLTQEVKLETRIKVDGESPVSSRYIVQERVRLHWFPWWKVWLTRGIFYSFRMAHEKELDIHKEV